MTGKYIPTYGEIKKKVLEETGLHDLVFENKVNEYEKKYPENVAKDRALVAYLLARDLGVEVRVKTFTAGISRKIGEIQTKDKGINIDQCYLVGKWKGITSSGNPCIRFVIADETGAVLGMAGGDNLGVMEQSEIGDVLSFGNANVLELKSKDSMVTAFWKTNEISKPEKNTLPSFSEFRKDIQELEDGKFVIIEGIAVDCERSIQYIGCPTCHKGLRDVEDVEEGSNLECPNCKNDITAERLYFTTLVINDGTSDVMCSLAPRFSFDETLVGTIVQVNGTYRSKNDTIDVCHFEAGKMKIEQLLKAKPRAEEVTAEKAVSKVEKPAEAPIKEPPTGVTENIIQDILAFINFVGPLSKEVIEKNVEEGKYVGFTGTADDIINEIVKRGDGKFEEGYLKKI